MVNVRARQTIGAAGVFVVEDGTASCPRVPARMFIEALAVPALAYAAAVGFLAARQRSFIFRPPAERPDPAAMAGAGFSPAGGEGDAGAAPRFWISPARAPDARTVVFLHGNASTVADGASKLAPLREAGLGVMLVEYPGYGGAPGRPTEATIMRQAEEALDLLGRAGIGPRRLVLWGESLGTGLATRLAVQVDGLRHTGTGWQGDGAIDGQHGGAPGVGIEVVGHEIPRAISQCTGAAGRLTIMRPCTHANRRHRAR